MDAAVAVPVRDVEIAGRRHHHLGRLVERPRRARGELDVLGGARVGRLAPSAENHQRLAVQGVLQGHVVIPVGQVDHVIDDAEAVGVGDGAAPPRAEVGAVSIEDDDGRVLPLEGVDAILGVGGHRAHLTEGPPAGELGPRLVQLVAVAAAADDGHRTLLPPSRMRVIVRHSVRTRNCHRPDAMVRPRDQIGLLLSQALQACLLASTAGYASGDEAVDAGRGVVEQLGLHL